ncbi:MAG: T9SS type A sorting domain-containing protein [Bacteroidales bacterium]|nr:T9SS type A sorting domain-containing protein [Bacteroidales bacterium]
MKLPFTLFLLTFLFTGYQAKSQALLVHTGSSIKVENGTTLDITSGNLVLKSGATGDVSLIDLGAVTFSGGGHAEVERYLTHGKWHLISSPVASATASMFVGDYLQYFTESTNQFSDVVSIAAPLNIMQGYALWTIDEIPSTEVFTGITNTGNHSRSFTQGGQGFNLMGNPYPSAIDWDEVAIPAELSGAFWLFDPTTGEFGEYKYYISGGGEANTTSQYIPSGQGFFVRSTGGSGTLVLSNASRAHSSQAFYKQKGADPTLLLKATGNNITTQTAIRFNPSATAAVDRLFDVNKLTTNSPDVPVIYSMVGNEKMAINTLPSVQGNETVAVLFKAGLSGNYTLTASSLSTIDPSVPVFLEDVSMNYFQDLRLNPDYGFAYVPYAEKEFKIHFREVTNINSPDQLSAPCFLTGNMLYVNFSDDFGISTQEAIISVYSITGQLLLKVNTRDAFNSIPFKGSQSIYLVNLSTNRYTTTIKVFNQ